MIKKLFTSLLFFIVVFTVVSVAADVYYYQRLTHHQPPMEGWICRCDLRVFWTAGYMFKNYAFPGLSGHPSDPWQEKEFTEFVGPYRDRVYNKEEPFYHFRYSPFAALVMAPLSFIRYPADALALWLAMIGVAMLISMLLFVRKACSDFALSMNTRYIILWGTFLASLRFYLMNISIGQSDIFITMFFVLFLIAYTKCNDIASGLLLALICQFKPAFFPVVLYFLFVRKWKLAASALFGFLALLLTPTALIGFGKTIALIKGWFEILGMSISSQILIYKNQSFIYFIVKAVMDAGLVKSVGIGKILSCVLSASFTTASYLALFLFRRSAKDPEGKKFKYLEVSILIIATQVFSPLTWIAQLASLMIPAGTALLFASSATKGRRSIYAALALFAALSIVAGTDLTNFLPAIDQAHFPNIAIGAVFLAYALVRSYQS